MSRSRLRVRAKDMSYPPPYAQSSPTMPDAAGAQSAPAAQRDDSLATNPQAGLVTESHPPTRRRGRGRADVFAVVACLAGLAWPTAAFALGHGVTVSETALMVPEGGSATYTLVLDTQPTNDVTITVAPSFGDDENLTASPETLIFTNSTWSMQQTVTVLAAEDDDSEAGTALFTHTVAGPGTAYDGLQAPGVTATEIDNDPAGVMVSETAVLVPEDGSASYTIVLKTLPTADVRIEVTRVTGDEDLTASSDTDTHADPDSLTLAFTNSNWNTTQTVTVSAAEDDDGEAGVAEFGHNVISPGTVYHGVPTPGVRANEDDDDPVEVIISPTALSVPEGGSATYTVRLGTKPLNDVVRVEATRDQLSDDDLTVTSDTDMDTDMGADFDSVALLFTDSNWHTEQTVTVSAAEDADDVDGVANFSHVTAGDEDYYEIYIDPVTATEADNDKDVIRPRVKIQTEVSALVGGAFEVTIRFSESVRGFTLRDIGVSNGTASNFNRVSSRTYTVTITPEESGEVRVEVASNVARDWAGNRNRAAEPLVIETDLERPEVTIEGPMEPVGMAGFEVMITFSEPVTGFELEDIQVTNGTASNFTKVSPREYTVTITPEESGEVKVDVGEDFAEDGAGNGNETTEPIVIEVDLERPEVTIEGPTEPEGMERFEVTITFSEPVEGFVLEEIQVSNGTASNFNTVSPRIYTVTITPEESGEVKVEVKSNVAQDAAGNGNQAAEPLTFEADLAPPQATIEGPSEPVPGPFQVTIRFDEPVEGFELEDIEVSNGTASNFNTVSPRIYTVTITPEESGEVKAEVKSNVAQDAAGNGNQAAEPLTFEADLAPPQATVEGPSEPVTGPFQVTIRFDEPVEGFELEDVEVSNGAVIDLTQVSPSEYRATIVPTVAGPLLVVVVSAGIAQDRAGNGNHASEPFHVQTKLLVSFDAETYTAAEGGEAIVVKVTLSQASDEEVAVPIRLTRPEATEPSDYTVLELPEWNSQEGTGKLTLPIGEAEGSFKIEANHDGDGEDEVLELGFGELPDEVILGEPGMATVTLADKGLVELTVSFGRADYQIKEGQEADIELKVSPAADRRVDVPLEVALGGGASEADYSRLPASMVFEEGESHGKISIAVLADEENDPGEAIVLSLGALPAGVSPGNPPTAQVNFVQYRTAGQFSRSLEVTLAVLARSTAASAQTAIFGRFERYRQWTRIASSGAMQGQGISDAARADGAEPTHGSWLRSFSLGSLGSFARSDQTGLGVSAGTGMGPVAWGGQTGYGQDRPHRSGIRGASLRPGSSESSGMRVQDLSLSGASFEMPVGASEQETSWIPVLWGQGDLQRFNGDLTGIGMVYRGGLEAAHVGLDLYANDRMLAGMSFMRSWGDVDYTDDGVDGVSESDLYTIYPYLYWQPKEPVSVWGIGGLGRGQVDVKEPGRTHCFDADFRMFAGGIRSGLTRRGSNELGVRADAFTAQLETEATQDIAKVGGAAHRGRLMLEWVHDQALSVGRSLSVRAEAGGRIDGGDADRGRGVETGSHLRYLDANHGLDLALHGRVLVMHASDYRDWGLGVQASWDPGEKQRGFRASMTSSWGRHGGGQTTLWDKADAVMRRAGTGAMAIGSQVRMEGEVSYAGLKAPGLRGLLTPYSRLRWAGRGRELACGTSWSLPTRSQQTLPLMMELETKTRKNGTGPADLAVLARMSYPF